MISFKKQIFIFLSLCSVSSLLADITVDASVEKQEFLGFGAQIWPGQEKLEPSFAALGIRWARLSAPGMRECPLTEGSVDDFADYFQSKIVTDQFRSTYEMLKRNRVTLVLNAFSIPVAWLDQENQLPNERLELFTRMWAGAVKCLVENGMSPQWLELFNEPDGTWSGRCWPDKYNRVVQMVRQELDILGYKEIRICGPGLGHVDLQGPDKWVNTLDSKGVEAIGAWSIHGYEWRRRESAAVVREELNSGFLASVRKKDPKGEKPLFVTEYGSFNTNYHGKGFLSPRDSYLQRTAAQIPAWNVRVIENGLSFLNEGINALIYWQLADIAWEETNFGIHTRLSDGGSPQMIYDALRGLFPEVAEGFRVVQAEQEPDSDVYAAALKKEGRLVCCMINRSAEPCSIQLNFKNYGPAIVVKKNIFENGRLYSAEPKTQVNDKQEVTIPGDGYVTLVLQQTPSKITGTVTVHPEQPKQKIEGFGGCSWTGDPGSLSIMQELGMSWVRFNIQGINSFNQPELSTEKYKDYFEQVTEWDRIRYLWDIKKSAGLKFMMVSFGAPSCWCDEKKTLKEAYIDNFAKLWVAAVKAYADKGCAPEYVELFNEPDGDWDTFCSPENYNRAVKAVRRRLDVSGLKKVKIVGPGRSHIDFGRCDKWIDALDADGVDAIGAFSVHGWTFDGPESHSSQYVRNSVGGFLNSANAKDPQQKQLRIMTEFSTKDTVFDGIKFGNHAKQFSNTAADSHIFAVAVVEDLLSHLNSGFNAILFWQMSDQWWEPAGWGLMGRMGDGYLRKPVFNALKTLLPEIPPGFRVVRTENTSGAYTAAFVRGKRLVIALVNSTNEKQIQMVQLTGSNHAVLLKLACFTATGISTDIPRLDVTDEWIAELPGNSVTVAIFEMGL